MPSCCRKSHAQSVQHAFAFMTYHACNLETLRLKKKKGVWNTISFFNSLEAPWEHKTMSFWWRKATQGKKKNRKKTSMPPFNFPVWLQSIENAQQFICCVIICGYSKLCIVFKGKLFCVEKNKKLDYSGALCHEYYWTLLPPTESGWLPSIKPLFITTAF